MNVSIRDDDSISTQKPLTKSQDTQKQEFDRIDTRMNDVNIINTSDLYLTRQQKAQIPSVTLTELFACLSLVRHTDKSFFVILRITRGWEYYLFPLLIPPALSLCMFFNNLRLDILQKAAMKQEKQTAPLSHVVYAQTYLELNSLKEAG